MESRSVAHAAPRGLIGSFSSADPSCYLPNLCAGDEKGFQSGDVGFAGDDRAKTPLPKRRLPKFFCEEALWVYYFDKTYAPTDYLSDCVYLALNGPVWSIPAARQVSWIDAIKADINANNLLPNTKRHARLAMSGMLLMEIESCGRGGVSRDAIDGCLLSSPSASPQELELASTAATWDRSWGAVTTVEHSPKGMVFNFDH